MSKADASEKMTVGTPGASAPDVGEGLAVGMPDASEGPVAGAPDENVPDEGKGPSASALGVGENLAMVAPHASEKMTVGTPGAGGKQVMGKPSATKKPAMGRLGRFMRAIEPVALVALPIVMALWAWLRLPNAALVTSACAIVALVPFFVSFEAERRRARDIMPIIVMTALAVAGRLIFAPVPAVKPVTALIIITGLCFGRDEGFITGALTMLVSNIFFGQGPWTPWQMFSMGLIGYLAGVLGSRGLLKHRWSIGLFGFLMVFLYGFIMDTWTIVGFLADVNTANVFATYTTGFFNNLAGAISTVVFLVPIAISWPRMFGRIKSKYQIGPAA